MATTKIDNPNLFDFSSLNTALQLPTGDTASRPSAPSTGEWRYNNELKYVEFWDSTAWRQIDTEPETLIAKDNFNISTYTGSGATYSIDSKFDQAAYFNGSTSYIETSLILPADSTMSFACWTKRNNTQVTSGDVYIIADYNSVPDAWRFGLRFQTSDQKIYIDIGNGSAIWQQNTNYTLQPDTWTHLVVTIDGTAIKLYADNILRATLTSTVAFGTAGADPITFGRPGVHNCCYYTGSLDQVRIYSSTLTSSQVSTLYGETATTAATLDFPTGAGCIAAYQFDGNANDVGTTPVTSIATYQLNYDVTSIPSNSYPGTASSITYSTGLFGNAAVFSGGAARIDLPQTILGSGSTKTFSISQWFQTSSTTEQYINNTAASSSNTGFGIFTTSSNGYLRFQVSNGSGSSPYLSLEDRTVQDGKWHNVVATYSSAGGTNDAYMYLYLDGEDVTSLCTPGNGWTQGAGATWSSFTIPRISLGNYADSSTYPSGLYPFIGSMDQVRYFNTALPQAAVTSLYNETDTTAVTPNIYYSTYPGTASSTVGFVGSSFKPDFVWIKVRNSAAWNHLLMDQVRGFASSGNAEIVSSNNDLAQYDRASISSFDTNGFSLGTYGGSNEDTSKTYVAWFWKAGGRPDTDNLNAAGQVPTAGSVKINGSDLATALAGTTAVTRLTANTNTGFSIVRFPVTNTNIQVAHGLDSAPELILWKNLSSGDNWYVYSNSLSSPNTQYLKLDQELLEITNNTNNFSSVTSTTFTTNLWGGSATNSIISYCFHSVSGYQKIGFYTGNNTNPGPSIFTTDDGTQTGDNGFQPAFILIKKFTDAVPASTDAPWYLYDDRRDNQAGVVGNPRNAKLVANSDAAENPNTAYNVNFNRDGFQIMSTDVDLNENGSKYIFLAISS